MQWTSKGSKGKGKSKGVPCPTTNAAERAMLEGYRLGQASAAKYGETSYDAWGGKGSGKGAGKGAWGKSGGNGDQSFFCCWKDCKAGRMRQATWWKPDCHCCCRPKAAATKPPVEQMAQWAYEARKTADKEEAERIAAKGGKDAAGKGQAKGGGAAGAAGKKGSAHIPPAEPGPDADAKLREERLKELKTIKEQANKPAAAPEASPIAEAMANHLAPGGAAQLWCGAKVPETAVKVVLDKELVVKTEKLSVLAAAVVTAVQQEKRPSTIPLETAEAACEKLLSGVATCASVEGREAAQKAFKATLQCITTLEGSGAALDDPILTSMLERKVKQEKEVLRMKDKAPSLKLRKLALVEAQDRFKRAAQAQKEFSDAGKAKAVKRSKERLAQLDEMTNIIAALRQSAEEQCLAASDQHDARAAMKAAQVVEVDSILDEKVAVLDSQMIIDEEDSEEEWGKDVELTEEEKKNEALVLDIHKLQKKNSDLLGGFSEAARAQAQEDVNHRQAQQETEKEERERMHAKMAHIEGELRKSEQREAVLQKAAENAEAAAAQAPPPGSPTAAEAEAARFNEWATTIIDTISPSKIPELNPKKEQLAVMADLHCHLQLWQADGGMMPVTIGMIEANTKAGTDAINVLSALIGPEIYKFNEDLSIKETVVPRQLMMLALYATDRLREKYVKDQAAKQKSTQAYEGLKELAKRRRTAMASDDA